MILFRVEDVSYYVQSLVEVWLLLLCMTQALFHRKAIKKSAEFQPEVSPSGIKPVRYQWMPT